MLLKMFDVLCVGILVADVMAKPIEKIPDKGKLELVERITMYTGGCAVNTGIDLSKIGICTAIIGKVGNDGFGRFMDEQLRLNNVNTDGLVKDDNANTSASVVISNSDGERSFIHCLGANALFTESDIDYNIVKNSKIIFVAGTMLMPSFDGEQCALFLKKCKEMGKITALDTAWDSKGRWMKALAPAMPYLDYFLPSIEEAVLLSGKTEPEDIADVFLGMGPHTIAIKLGKDGCFIKSKTGEKLSLPTFERIKPVDTTGAGDSFCAGFLTGIAKGWSLHDSGRFANAVGTHCIMQSGASTGIKSEAETIKFMNDYDNGLI
jgi:sugar/nucleoside kinase (ribokinase family)